MTENSESSMPTPPADLRTVAFTTPVGFTRGLLGKVQPGTIAHDGAGRVTLTDATGAPVFSKTLTELGKVRRAEFALYFKVDGATVCAMFGDPKSYVLGQAAREQFGAVGAYQAQKKGRQLNEQSGLEQWVALVKQGGDMGLNASPEAVWKNFFVKPLKWIAIVGGAILLIAIIAQLF